MKKIKIKIPKLSDKYKLQIYRSKFAEDINTISKIKELSPIAIIDESICPSVNINNKKYYELYDDSNHPSIGIEYFGPPPNLIYVTEYSMNVNVIKINNYTYANEIVLEPIEIKKDGIMFYYSVIGVDEENNLITHLSKVNGILIETENITGSKHIYSSNDSEKENPQWEYITSVPYNDKIKIGNLLNENEYNKFGCPVVNDVYIFPKEEIKSVLKTIEISNYMIIKVPNIWKKNNKIFNYRKLNSYKIQTVIGESYGEFSLPTYQSLVPVSLEKMTINISHIENEEIKTITKTVLRKDGIYNKNQEYNKLGFNKYNIPLNENIAIFSEGSSKDCINFEVEAEIGKNYEISVFITDVYGNESETIRTNIET